MQALKIDNRLIEIAQLFGNSEQIIREALKIYSIDKCQKRISKAMDHIIEYTKKYNCDYTSFKYFTQMDDDYIANVEEDNPLWESDAFEWEYWSKEHTEWSQILRNILRI